MTRCVDMFLDRLIPLRKPYISLSTRVAVIAPCVPNVDTRLFLLDRKHLETFLLLCVLCVDYATRSHSGCDISLHWTCVVFVSVLLLLDQGRSRLVLMRMLTAVGCISKLLSLLPLQMCQMTGCSATCLAPARLSQQLGSLQQHRHSLCTNCW